jgi:pyruvate/oxaloacetate carboxyltransferase
MSDELDGDGIGGAVLEILTGTAFRLLVSHTRKYNKGDYGKTEKIIMGLIKEGEDGQHPQQTKEDLERALKGKFVTCKVQYRDKKTDALVCNVFVQRPPEDSV